MASVGAGVIEQQKGDMVDDFREWLPDQKEAQDYEDLKGWLKSVTIFSGEGSIDLGAEGPVYVAIVHDASSYHPEGAIAVEQNSYYDYSNEALEAAFDQVREQALEDKEYVAELMEEWGDEWESILTERFEGKVWKFKRPEDAAAAISTSERAKEFIEIEQSEP